MTIVSRREKASRGVLAWTVLIDPSTPVFMACSMSSASAPRHSPTMMRSGRMRSAVRSSMPLVDAAFLVQVRRTRFELHHVALLELQLGRVFDGDDALLLRDEAGERVQHGGLAGAGSAGDQHGASCACTHAARKRSMPGVIGLVLQHLVLRDHVAAEAADAEARAIQRQRRNDGVDARAILQARVHDRLRFVDAAAHLRDDLLDDVQQVRVVLESDRGFGELAVALDEDLVVAVDQDVARCSAL